MNTAPNTNTGKPAPPVSANQPVNGPITVNKLNNNKPKPTEDDEDEFKISDLNSEEKKINNLPPSSTNTNSTTSAKVLNTEVPEDLDAEIEDMDTGSKTSTNNQYNGSTSNNLNTMSKNSSNLSSNTTNSNKELMKNNESEFPMVSAQSAIRNNENKLGENKLGENKTMNNEPKLEDVKPLLTTPVLRTKKAHKRGAKGTIDLKTLKAAHLLVNQTTGSVKVDTSDKQPTIVKLIQPVNKANIKLKTFKTKYEKEYELMKKMSTNELLALKDKLESIEFDEVANTNIINGLLELVDDHHLKQLTIEKMLKMGDITINF